MVSPNKRLPLHAALLLFLIRIYVSIQNTDYKEAGKNADLLFEELRSSLNKQQAKLLEQYFCANNAATAIMERLIYQQGMRDMLVILISILKNDY